MEKMLTIAILSVGLVILLMMIFPLPMLVLDILIAVNILFALVIVIIVLRIRKKVAFSLLWPLLFESIFFNMAMFTACHKSLIRGTEFDGRLIRFVSFLFAGFGDIVLFVISSAILILTVIIVISVFIGVIVIMIRDVRVDKIALQFKFDSIKKPEFFIQLYVFIIGVIVVGWLINTLDAKYIDTEILTYPFVFASVILFMLPPLLFYIAVWRLVTREFGK